MKQGIKNEPMASANPYYAAGNHSDHRPVVLEQQWQQFQQQVKVEGGQQQYDPYSAADDAELHIDSTRQQQQVSLGNDFMCYAVCAFL